MTMRKITELAGRGVRGAFQPSPGEVAFELTDGTTTAAVPLPPGPPGIGVENMAVTVGRVVGDAAPQINTAIADMEAAGGGTVYLAYGHVYEVDGTIHMRSGITLDLNGSTIRAMDNAAFTVVDLGVDAVNTAIPFTPASIKPVISIIGQVGARLHDVTVQGGTVDGNGYNQPDDGSYANIAVHEADHTIVNVTSVDSKPDLTINLPDGSNTGRRAFCLFIGKALRTTVRGTYRNAGYDTIGIRGGAVDTTLDNLTVTKAQKGAVQLAFGPLRTKIIGGLYDNTEGTTTASHAIFCHSAKWVDVVGATMRAGTGSCFTCFGDTTWGTSENVSLASVAFDQVGDGPALNLVGHTDRVKLATATMKKTGTVNPLIIMTGANKNITLQGVDGILAGKGPTFILTDVDGFNFLDNNIQATAATNPLFSITQCKRGKITGRYVQGQGAVVYSGPASANRDITISATLVGNDAVYFHEPDSNINLVDCDLTGIANPNPLRVFGASSGSVRDNRGAVTTKTGTATLPAASATVTVSHGLWQGTNTISTPVVPWVWKPQHFQVSFAGDPGSASKVWVSKVTPTQVTFATDAAPGSDVLLSWSANMAG